MSPGGGMSRYRALRAGGKAIRSCSSSYKYAAARARALLDHARIQGHLPYCNKAVAARLRGAVLPRCPSGLALMRSGDDFPYPRAPLWVISRIAAAAGRGGGGGLLDITYLSASFTG
jgi:hypothetical protein